ncbi:ABC transporter permease [Microbacterium suwonense]|uniref:ABC transporter permease n=1 Tax=Microbacterium suwonense TaxID=683047 RepID=A0ABM8FWT5_9MICO|nr:ABC transporter permease [Microbacterium suwonense]BDZ40153.1 ABC transporter permease [Microbacterium suwonense]
MTAIQARATHIPAPARNLTFVRQLRSELIKLVTVRGTWWSVGIVAALSIGLAFIVTATISPPMDNIIMAVVAPVQFTMMLAGILGVISVSGEYSTGMIRSTFTANPVRGAVVAAKATVLAAFMFVVALVIFVIAAVGISPLAASKDMALDWSDPAAVILPILAASAAMALFALLGVGLGFVLRSGAGAIAVTVGILFVLPVIVSLLGVLAHDVQWIGELGNYLPSSAAPLAILPQDGAAISTPVAWITLAAWPAAALLGGWAVVRGRDV